jgi:antitoxin YefM
MKRPKPVQQVAQPNEVIAMRVVDFSEARNNLEAVVDQVIDDADYTIITRRDAPDAVLMSLDTFNGLMETVHLLKSPANAAHLTRSIEQYRKGQIKQQDLRDADQ